MIYRVCFAYNIDISVLNSIHTNKLVIFCDCNSHAPLRLKVISPFFDYSTGSLAAKYCTWLGL